MCYIQHRPKHILILFKIEEQTVLHFLEFDTRGEKKSGAMPFEANVAWVNCSRVSALIIYAQGNLAGPDINPMLL